jgi:histidinol phosphatase-like PHP family hydrolase
VTLSNADIAELLARRGDETEGPRQRAYRRSSAAAFLWPEEAARLVVEGRPLTELRYVGDRLASRINDWIVSGTPAPEPLPERRGFISLADATEILRRHPDWRERLRGDLQMHTVYSDGLESVWGMAEAASQLGYSYIAITDHSSGQRIPQGMDADAMARQRVEIGEVNNRLDAEGSQLRVLSSIEVNLRPDGSPVLGPEELAGFDLVIGSFHSQLRIKDDQTDRYLMAVRSGCIDIVGHPRGRMYNRRAGLHADWERVFETAIECDVAFEINSEPPRQDLQIELLELARDKGLRLSIGTDAHSIPELDFVPFALASSAQAGIKPEQIVNFGPLEDLLAWRESRSKRV